MVAAGGTAERRANGCEGVTLISVAERSDPLGRGWQAARSYRLGEVVLQERQPLVCCARLGAQACDACLRVLPGDQTPGAVALSVGCEGCAAVRYCSEACKAGSAALHALECPCLSRSAAGGHDITSALRLAARFLWMQEEGAMREGETRAFLDECRRQAGQRLSSMAEGALEDLQEECVEVLAYMGRGRASLAPESTAEEAQASVRLSLLVLRLWSMAVGSERGIYGSAWFPRASLVNHSCRPNCGVAFLPQGGLQLRSIRPIPEGEELFISYIDVFQACRFRREDLQSSFSFLCGCQRCSEGDAAPCELEMQALRCQDDSCRAAIHPALVADGCPKCGEAMPASSHELAHLLGSAAKLYTEGRRLYRGEEVEAATDCLHRSLAIRELLLHGSNVDLLVTWEAAARAFIASRQWDAAERCLVSAIQARRCLAPVCGYDLGSDTFETLPLLLDLARVLLESGEPRRALEQLGQARRVVLLTRGEGSDLLEEIASIEAAAVPPPPV